MQLLFEIFFGVVARKAKRRMNGADDYRSNNQNGLGTSSLDYHAHVSKLARTPSVLTDVPHYGNTNKMFNNTRVLYVEDYEENKQERNRNTPQSNEKVEVIEYKETVESPNNVNSRVYEEIVESGADSAQQKRRGFGLCKWRTFKHY